MARSNIFYGTFDKILPSMFAECVRLDDGEAHRTISDPPTLTMIFVSTSGSLEDRHNYIYISTIRLG